MKFISFQHYLIESFDVRSIDYGTNENMDDKKIERIGYVGELYYSFFKFDQYFYIVSIDVDKDEISFGASKDFSLNPKDYKDLSNYEDDEIESPFKIKNIIKFFNSLFYVMFEIIKVSQPEVLIFTGAIKKLTNVYGKILRNKSFISLLSKEGYIIKDDSSGTYRIEKDVAIKEKQ